MSFKLNSVDIDKFIQLLDFISTNLNYENSVIGELNIQFIVNKDVREFNELRTFLESGNYSSLFFLFYINYHNEERIDEEDEWEEINLLTVFYKDNHIYLFEGFVDIDTNIWDYIVEERWLLHFVMTTKFILIGEEFTQVDDASIDDVFRNTDLYKSSGVSNSLNLDPLLNDIVCDKLLPYLS